MPYSPYGTDRSGEIFAQGILSAGDSIGRGIRDFGKIRAEQKQRDKEIAEEADRYSTILEAMGVPKGKVASMSLAQKKGTFDSMAFKHTMGLQKEEEEQKAAWKSAVGRMSNGSQGPSEPAVVAAMRSGVTDPDMLGQAANLQEAMRGGFMPQVVNAGDGYKAMTTSPSSAQVLPSIMGGNGDINFQTAPNGQTIMIPSRGSPRPLAMPKSEGSGDDFYLVQDEMNKLDKVEQEIAEISAGPDKRSVAGISYGKNKAQRLAAKKAERNSIKRRLDMLRGGMQDQDEDADEPGDSTADNFFKNYNN